LLRQLPDLNEIIRRLTVNRDRYSFNRNIFLATAISIGWSGNFEKIEFCEASPAPKGGVHAGQACPNKERIKRFGRSIDGKGFCFSHAYR
jgi:biotin synthase-like enzyme